MLTVRGLSVRIKAGGEWRTAVDHVSFTVNARETLCIVGESGCGKSLTAKSIMRLHDDSRLISTQGSIELDGRQLLTLGAKEMREVRGLQIAMVFQEPMTALNPVLTVGEQIAEPLRYHQQMSRTSARRAALELLGQVRIPDPETRIDRYPHELSGGQRQRVMIAAAIACKPKVLLADEPTTALDVTNQLEILHLLADLQREVGMALVLITHDLGVVAHIADRVAVMYAGEIVETAETRTLFTAPAHPYTQALLGSIPRLDRDQPSLETIAGQVPPLGQWPQACRFIDRCRLREARCELRHPELLPARSGDSNVRCVVTAQ